MCAHALLIEFLTLIICADYPEVQLLPQSDGSTDDTLCHGYSNFY